MALDPSSIFKGKLPSDFESDALSNKYKQGMIQQQQNTDQSQQLTMALKRTELVNKLLSTVTDQTSLNSALQQAQAAGIDTKNVNPVYNPAEIEQHKNALLSAHDQMLKMLYSTGKLGPKNSGKQPMISPQPPAANNSYEGLPEPSGTGLDPTSMQPLPSNLLKPTGVTGQPLGSIPAPMSGNDIAAQPSVVKPEDLFGGGMLPPVTGKPLPVEKPKKLSGDEFLATIKDENHAASIKAVGDGDVTLTSVLSRMKPADKEQFIADVKRYKGDYSANNYKGQGNFMYGKQGDQVRSFNVATEHLASLEPLITALGNGDIKAINTISNTIKNQFGGVPINNFETAKAIVADEIAKAIIGGQNALQDRADLQSKLSQAKSTDQLMGVVSTFKDLMAGQLTGLDTQYQAATGKKDFEEKLLTGAAKKQYQKYKASKDEGALVTPSGVKYKIIK